MTQNRCYPSDSEAAAPTSAGSGNGFYVEHVADVLRDVWDSYRDDREGFIDCLLDTDRSGLRVEVDRA